MLTKKRYGANNDTPILYDYPFLKYLYHLPTNSFSKWFLAAFISRSSSCPQRSYLKILLPPNPSLTRPQELHVILASCSSSSKTTFQQPSALILIRSFKRQFRWKRIVSLVPVVRTLVSPNIPPTPDFGATITSKR